MLQAAIPTVLDLSFGSLFGHLLILLVISPTYRKVLDLKKKIHQPRYTHSFSNWFWVTCKLNQKLQESLTRSPCQILCGGYRKDKTLKFTVERYYKKWQFFSRANWQVCKLSETLQWMSTLSLCYDENKSWHT